MWGFLQTSCAALMATIGALSVTSPMALATQQTAHTHTSKVPLPVLKSASLETTPLQETLPKKTKTFGLKEELAPLNDTGLTTQEQTALINALKAVYKGKANQAEKFAKQITHKGAKKLLHWYTLRSQSTSHSIAELQEFLAANPGWPSRSRLQTKIERAFLKGQGTNKTIQAHFKQHKPKTNAGKIAYAQTLLGTEQKNKAIDLIKTAYQDPALPLWVEREITTKHKNKLSTKDHKIRTDRLLYTNRRSKITAAMRAAKHLNEAERQGAKFRAAVIRRQTGTALKLLPKLEKQIKQQPGVHLARIELAIRRKKYDAAIKHMKMSNYKKDEITDKDRWWRVRQKLARHAIAKNNHKAAYDITSKHEHPSVNRYKEAEFLSGWLALRHLKKPELAAQHFEKFKAAADGPLSRSKSAYWLGRALKAQNKPQAANDNFKASAIEFNTFYGQLAAYELDKSNPEIIIPPSPKISANIAKRFTDRDEVQAILIAHQIKNSAIARIFFAHLRYHLNDPQELALLAELAASLNYNQSTVRIGKTAMAQKILTLAPYSYPVRFMPKYKLLRSIPEPAMVYAIARQESEFNYQIKSRAGARGLLQVMPGTLKHVARKYNLKSRTAWLTQKPAFNAQIASAYIGDRHDEFSGSYIMTFAAFNAGPGRVRQWTREFGDPRSAHIDPIDWIERIPFRETRKYVQKVMANLQVYRARLQNGKAPITAHKDIYRGKFKTPAEAN